MSIQSYQDLRVWQKGMELSQKCYQLTKRFPREEAFGMTSQIRRASVSIPANIAEGYGRESKGAYQQFLRIAQGSVKELETLLILSLRVGLANEEGTTPLLQETDALGKMLRSLIRSLDAQS